MNIRRTGYAAGAECAAALVSVPFENRGLWLLLREGKKIQSGQEVPQGLRYENS